MPALTRATVAAALLFATTLTAAADEALVAVAANFAGAADAISTEFTKVSGHHLQITTGATGKLYAQIAQGAPFAVMLSADAQTPARLEAENLAVAGTQFTYALGALTLWSGDADRIGSDPKAALQAADTLAIAIANPELAPYGVAARDALQALGLWDAVQAKIVMGENIGQTFAMVDSGAAQIGFVAASAVAVGPARGSRWDVPQALFTPIRQDAILLAAGADNAAAVAFMGYLASDGAKAIVQSFGYGTE